LIVLDTSALLSALDTDQPRHRDVVNALAGERQPLVLSPFVLAELDYLLARELGPGAAIELLRDVAAGAYTRAEFDRPDVAAAVEVLDRFDGLGIGLTDASVVVLAERLGTRRVLTLDHRRFSALRTSRGEALELLP
jgi:predicted nucleic acid-binding protein